MIKIFLSPETQNKSYAVVGFNEEMVMNKVTDVVQRELLRTGQFEIYRNDGSDRFKSIDDSNLYVGSNGLHIAIHTNAGGGHGCEVFAFAPKTGSDDLAKILFNRISALTPMKDRAVKYSPKFDEVHMTTARAVLIELAFHDNTQEAQWIIDNVEQLGIELAKGICEYKGVTYVPVPVAPTQTDYKALYEEQLQANTNIKAEFTSLNAEVILLRKRLAILNSAIDVFKASINQ